MLLHLHIDDVHHLINIFKNPLYLKNKIIIIIIMKILLLLLLLRLLKILIIKNNNDWEYLLKRRGCQRRQMWKSAKIHKVRLPLLSQLAKTTTANNSSLPKDHNSSLPAPKTFVVEERR
jgi:hypothetical protein